MKVNKERPIESFKKLDLSPIINETKNINKIIVKINILLGL